MKQKNLNYKMTEDKLKSLVYFGDIYAAIKTKYGSGATVNKYTVHNAVPNLEGLTSLLLRVKVNYKIDNVNNETSFIVKRYPVLKEQIKLINECKLFEREVAFFNDMLPLMKMKPNYSNLPVVNCYLAHSDAIILDDLKASGYDVLKHHICDFGKIEMDLPHLRLIVRKLAQFHAASLDIEWLKLFPQYLEKDAYLESNNGVLFKNLVLSTIKTISSIIKEVYPNRAPKYLRWLQSSNCYDRLTKLTKENRNFVNVLCHGDFWENNVLFKLQPLSNKPLDIKIIDLQLFRFAPGSTDVSVFIYGATDKKFRDKHEKEILQAYVNAFNSYVCETPDRTTYDKFVEQYEYNRLLGMFTQLVYQPMRKVINEFSEDLPITKETFEIIFNDNSKEVLNLFKENSVFKTDMMLMVDELLGIMDKLGLSS